MYEHGFTTIKRHTKGHPVTATLPWAKIKMDTEFQDDIFEDDEDGEIQFDFIHNIAKISTKELIELNEDFMDIRFKKGILTDRHIIFDRFYEDVAQPPGPDMMWIDEAGALNMADLKTACEKLQMFKQGD